MAYSCATLELYTNSCNYLDRRLGMKIMIRLTKLERMWLDRIYVLGIFVGLVAFGIWHSAGSWE